MKFVAIVAILVVLLVVYFSLPGKGQVNSRAYDAMLKTLLSHTTTEISVDQAREMSAVYLDARAREEYDVSHIEGAIWVGYDDFDVQRVSEKVEAGDTVIVYCSVGYRSEKIAEKLNTLGYKHVFNLYGGLFEWVNREQPVVNESGQTQKVHAYDRSWGIWLNKGEKVYE